MTDRIPTEQEMDEAAAAFRRYAECFDPDTTELEREEAEDNFFAGWWARHTA